MTSGEIYKLVNEYVGVNGGYLGDFSYRTHHDFYASMDLDIDPGLYEGTTRDRFIRIIGESTPIIQARIIRGILERFPVGSSDIRTQLKYDQLLQLAARLDVSLGIASPSLRVSSDAVNRAITDAENLVKSSGATSGVDRVHTALHGYFRAVCDDAELSHNPNATMNQLYRTIREQHPALRDLGHRSEDISVLLLTFIRVLDVMNPLRNNASLAHPNQNLLDPPEAMLVINVTRTLLYYFDARLLPLKTVNNAKS